MNDEGKTFIYKTLESSSYSESTIDTGGTLAWNTIVLSDGYYELVAINENQWMLTIGYSTNISSDDSWSL